MVLISDVQAAENRNTWFFEGTDVLGSFFLRNRNYETENELGYKKNAINLQIFNA